MKNIFKGIILFGWLLVSCQESEQISAEQRYIVDTLYARELGKLKLKGDSICKIYRDTFYQQAVDSLQDEYLDNIDYYFRK